VKTSCGQNVLM